MQKIKIIKTLETKEISELDIELYNELFTKKGTNKIYEDNSPLDFIIDNRKHYADGEPLNINKLIKYLTIIKNKGSNYISIEHTVDHLGYKFEALSIKNATNEEINTKKQHDIDQHNFYKFVEKLNIEKQQEIQKYKKENNIKF